MYNGKQMEVTARIDRIDKKGIKLYYAYHLYIIAYFEDDTEIEKIMEVSVDDKVTIEGTLEDAALNTLTRTYYLYNSRFK